MITTHNLSSRYRWEFSLMSDYFDDEYRKPLKLESQPLLKKDVLSLLQQKRFMKSLFVRSASKTDRALLKALFNEHMNGTATGCRFLIIEL